MDREEDQEQFTIDHLVRCENETECDLMWDQATAFVREHADTRVLLEGPYIMMTAPASSDQELSITLSRIREKKGDGAFLFLELQCKKNPAGDELCQSDPAQKIRQSFRAAVSIPTQAE